MNIPWPKILHYVDHLLERKHEVTIATIIRGERGVGTTYHSQQTGITTTVKLSEGSDLCIPLGEEYTLQGARVTVLSLLSDEQYEFFVKDYDYLAIGQDATKYADVFDVAGSNYGVNYKTNKTIDCPFALNSLDLARYYALKTRMLELQVKTVTEFYNSPVDEAVAAYLEEAYNRVVKDYTKFLIDVLYSYLSV